MQYHVFLHISCSIAKFNVQYVWSYEELFTLYQTTDYTVDLKVETK